jgi:hypothetical protein
VSISLPPNIPDLWMSTIDNAKLSGRINRNMNLGFVYSGGMFLSPPAKIYAQEIMKSAGRVLNGGVCLSSSFYQSIKEYLNFPINEYLNESADWIAFEQGIAINSNSYSTGLIKYQDIDSFVIVKKGVRLPFSVKITDGITLIKTKKHELESFKVMCNFMGNDALRRILKFAGVKGE